LKAPVFLHKPAYLLTQCYVFPLQPVHFDKDGKFIPYPSGARRRALLKGCHGIGHGFFDDGWPEVGVGGKNNSRQAKKHAGR
jgi:hypothetical protein